MAQALTPETWSGEDVSIGDVSRALADLRDALTAPGRPPNLRTSVMTHIAWVPLDWLDRAWATLECSAQQELGRTICTEVVELRLHGPAASAPASVVQPLLVPDLPVFLRWRAQPPFGTPELEQLVDVADRLIVDSTEWPDLPEAYAELAGLFPRVAASDIAWARTGRWRALLASLWPGIAGVRTIRVTGTTAQAHLLAGWLRARLGTEIALEHEPAERLEGVDLDGEPAPFPPGDPPTSSELLSDELDRYGRDPIYEEAAAAAR